MMIYLLMDSDFTTVISEKQIEKASPSNSQRDLSPEEAGKHRLHVLLELKNPVLRIEATTPQLTLSVITTLPNY